MKTIQLFSTLLLLIITAGFVGAEPITGLVEKRKTLVKVYDVETRDQLSVDNQYGQVKINVWDRKEIRVDITVTANAPTDARASDYLNAISINEKREGNVIMLRTDIDRDNFGTSNWNSWRSNTGEKNFIQIDYVVHMPKGNALMVKNKFGNTDIPSFQAPLTVLSRYGNFSANALENVQNIIEVLYGSAKIGRMDRGNLEIRYSDLNLNQVENLTLVNKSGKVTIGKVGNLQADIDYSGATIGSVTNSCRVNLSYSEGFQVEQLSRTAENVDIQAAYSTVTLPGESNNFNVTITHGSFRLPMNMKVHYTNQPDKADANRATKQYEGKVGAGGGTNIRVISRFGDVRLKD